MDGNDRVVITQGAATVDHFLATSLHFRVAALNGGKIQFLVALPAAHR